MQLVILLFQFLNALQYYDKILFLQMFTLFHPIQSLRIIMNIKRTLLEIEYVLPLLRYLHIYRITNIFKGQISKLQKTGVSPKQTSYNLGNRYYATHLVPSKDSLPPYHTKLYFWPNTPAPSPPLYVQRIQYRGIESNIQCSLLTDLSLPLVILQKL